MSTNNPTWIATRVLTDPQGGPDLEVRIGIPKAITAELWECPYMIIEAGQSAAPQTGCGVDGFQALLQAQEAIRVALEKTDRKLCWLGGEPGLTGFTRSIPISFGLGLVRHLEALVENAVERYAQEAAAGNHGRPYTDL
ncbi:MAG: hypothetical protein JNJ46_20100 [Myxococcales bacterium]|nr:hypothetical protein [Myxococcales bacterium]